MDVIFLLSGLMLLATAGDALVRGSIAAAQRMHIPPIIIGLTIVAFGTSAPELIVSIEAALNNAPGLAIGNVVGSNISNVLLVLGLPAILMPLVFEEDGIRRSTVFLIAISATLLFVASNGLISRTEGMLLFALLVLYLTYNGVEATRLRNKKRAAAQLDELNVKSLSTPWILALVGFGVVGLGFGGKLTTDGALGVAAMLGVADSAVGLTIVALGTSLPELAASASAALRKQSGVVIGNVVGSSIFNILGITGLTALIIPLKVPQSIVEFDILVMIASTILIFPIAFFMRKISRKLGLAMTFAYATYIVLVFRNSVGL